MSYSGFINDSWRFNDHFTFNLGAGLTGIGADGDVKAVKQ